MTDDQTMRAVLCPRYGPPDTLELGRLPRPHPGPGEVRVRIHATTVTRTDTETLRAHPFFVRLLNGLIRPKMPTLGIDFAGVVDLVGGAVTEYKEGNRVFGLLPDGFGAHAEFVCVASTVGVARLPNDLPFKDAVIAEGAWYASGTTDQLKTGQRCLIYGASGAIGTAAVQLAKQRGAHVTAVVGTRHLDLARDLGADRVLNYETEDFTRVDDRFDLIFDAVGKTSWFACRKLLKDDGIFSATDLGPYWSNIFLSTWSGITRSGRVRVPFPEDAAGFVGRLAVLMAEGHVRGVFDRRYPLDQIVDAFRYVETHQKTGIVGIEVR